MKRKRREKKKKMHVMKMKKMMMMMHMMKMKMMMMMHTMKMKMKMMMMMMISRQIGMDDSERKFASRSDGDRRTQLSEQTYANGRSHLSCVCGSTGQRNQRHWCLC